MPTVPDIVAISAAREALDHGRALEALSDQRSMGERVFLALAVLGCSAFAVLLGRVGFLDHEPLAVAAFAFAILATVLVGAEVVYLRRRVKALTNLVLQQERKVQEA
jgi:hypothetical protein